MGHTYLFYDISPALAFWTSRTIPRIAVPFFFCVSGYFYIRGLKKGRNTFPVQIKGILSVYALWSLIYYCLSFVIALKNHESLSTFFQERVIYFLFDGSYYHFWYFPALIYAFTIAALFYKFGKMKGIQILAWLSLILYFLFFLGTDYIRIGQQIPVLKNIYELPKFGVIRGIFGMGLPFFMMGYFLNRFEKWYADISPAASRFLFAYWFTGFIIEGVCAINASSLASAAEELCVAALLMPSLFFLFIMLLKHPLPKYTAFSQYCRRLSNYIYYTHPLFLTVISTAAGMAGIVITETLMFVIIYAICLITAYLLYKIDTPLTRKLM